MSNTIRVYYTGAGVEHRLPDGQVLHLAKIVTAAGRDIVWAPPGKKVEKRLVKYSLPELISRKTGRPHVEEKKFWVVVDEPGDEWSHQDVTEEQLRVCMQPHISNGELFTESEFFKRMQPDDLDRKIAELQRLKAEKQASEPLPMPKSRAPRAAKTA